MSPLTRSYTVISINYNLMLKELSWSALKKQKNMGVDSLLDIVCVF